jgi:hypothetical protein
VGFDVADQLLIRLLHSSGIGEELSVYETRHKVFVLLNKAYDSERREVLHNNLIEVGVPLKLVRLIKMCLNETYSKICVGKQLSHKEECRILEYKNPVHTSQKTLFLRYTAQPVNAT